MKIVIRYSLFVIRTESAGLGWRLRFAFPVRATKIVIRYSLSGRGRAGRSPDKCDVKHRFAQ